MEDSCLKKTRDAVKILERGALNLKPNQLLSLLSVELTDRAAGGMGGSRKAWEVRLSRGGGKGFGFTLIQGVEEEGVFIARYSHISQTLQLSRVVSGGQAERCGLVGMDKVMAINRRAPTTVEEAVG